MQKRISWIYDIIKFIKRKNKISQTKKLHELSAKLKQRVKVLAAPIKGSKMLKEFKEEKQKFQNNPGRWLKYKVDGDKKEFGKGGRDETDITNFWKSIWSKESVEISYQWEEWEEVKKSINIRRNPAKVPFVSVGLPKKVIKKMKKWKTAGWDQISPFYWQKFTSIHRALQDAINLSFEHATYDDWETLGRTIMFAKKGKTST